MTRKTAVTFHNSYRPSNSRSPVKTTLIICEGNSEKIYFNRFRTRNSSLKVIAIDANGGNSKRLLKSCRGKIKEYGLSFDDGDTFSIVFDLDVYNQKILTSFSMRLD